jgi:hypothetical protein
MPYEIQFEHTPMGYAVACSLPTDEHVKVQPIGMATSADGELLSSWLAGLPTDVLNKISKIGPQLKPSQVDNLLAIVRADNSAVAYVNELEFIASIRVSPERILDRVEKGDAIFEHDIDDVGGVEIEGIDNPIDAGVILVCSDGWQKGLFFDVTPLTSRGSRKRDFAISTVLGGMFSQFRFQHVFGLTAEDWNALFQSKWFPFSGLRKETLKVLVSAIRCGRNPDELLPKIRSELLTRLPTLLEVWKRNRVFADHIALLERAAERYNAEDYISCTSILVPRIEGLLRTYHNAIQSSERPQQRKLCVSAIAGLANRHNSMLVPLRFQEYLERVYFSDFDDSSTDIHVSRHSVSHGVASASNFESKAATLALLICHQLYCNFSLSD